MHRAKTDLERNDKDILVSDRLDGVCQRAAGRRGKGVCSLCKVDTDRVEDSMQTREFSLESLANRVVKLEVQNRRLKKVGVISFIVATVVIAMGQAPAKKVIEANEFVLKDASGTALLRRPIPRQCFIRRRGRTFPNYGKGWNYRTVTTWDDQGSSRPRSI